MRRKLLLADDSITVQRVIELTFSDEGLDIVTVGDGAEAIERLRRDRPDIVLADLNMPGADGYAVAEHVKRESDLATHTRVVLLTGAFEPVDQERAKLLGVDGVLAKPFEPQVAIELVRQLLEQPPLAAARRPPQPVSDWAVDVSTLPPSPPVGAPRTVVTAAGVGAGVTGAGTGAAAAESAPSKPATPPEPAQAPAVAAGYPFEPGAAAAKSSPAELDDYFKRLDEALTNAGLTASPAVRDMLAESKESMSVATVTSDTADQAGGAARTTSAKGEARAPADSARAGDAWGSVGEERQMSGVPSRGPMNVTLVDAFSALLAAEQGEGSGAVAHVAPFWGPVPVAPADEPEETSRAFTDSRHVDTYENGRSTLDRADDGDDTVFSAEAPPSAVFGSGVSAASAESTIESTSAPAAAAVPAPAPAPVVSEEMLEGIVRRVLAETTDRLVREIVSAKVLDVAERLVREEIERLRAASDEEAQ